MTAKYELRVPLELTDYQCRNFTGQQSFYTSSRDGIFTHGSIGVFASVLPSEECKLKSSKDKNYIRVSAKQSCSTNVL